MMHLEGFLFIVLVLAGANSQEIADKEVRKADVKFLHIQSTIKFRYAKTNVTCGIKNNANVSNEVAFSVTLPERAFISQFLMEIDGIEYKAYLKGKEEAKKEYKDAVSSGTTAAHIESKATRYSNVFKISVNVEKMGDVKFVLIYEELLNRNFGYYEHIINLNPRQIVKDLTVDVFISESSNIKDLFVPQLRTGNEILEDETESTIAVKKISGKYAHIQYRPTVEQQKMGLKDSKNYGGQLAVQYDVERDYTKGGQVLVNDGYFVHFFAPEDLKPLRKFVVFILDTSGSMYGRRIEQLQSSMEKILSDLKENDYFSIMDFSYAVKVHNLDNSTQNALILPDKDIGSFGIYPMEREEDVVKYQIPNPYLASAENIEKAKLAVKKMTAEGGTNIYDALKNAITLAKTGIDKIRALENHVDIVQPLIIFLTDGEPTVGITDSEKIISMVKTSVVNEVPIYSLGFGSGADIEFLRKISLAGNNAIARNIYEASDAALQLNKFYETISSPVMSNITFSYLQDNSTNNNDTSKNKFLYFNKGAEIMVVGVAGNDFNPQVTGYTVDGLKTLDTTVIRDMPDDDSVIYIDHVENKTIKDRKPQKYSLERSWAYLTIKQLIDKHDNADSEEDKAEFKNKTVDLAQKYEFVTPFTSLVVVKPNATDLITTESLKTALDGGDQHFNRISGFSAPKMGVFYSALPPPSAGYPVPAFGLSVAPSPLSTSSQAFMVNRHSVKAEMSPTQPISIPSIDHRIDEGGVEEMAEVSVSDPVWLSPPDFISANQTLIITIDGETKFYIVKDKSDAEMNARTTEEKCIKPGGAEGICKHLRTSDCSVATIEEYKNYFCAIEQQFAGICC